MKKLLILFLLPFMMQCAKDPVKPNTTGDNNTNPTDTTHNTVPEKKCYLNKISYSSNAASFVYERNAQNLTVRTSNYNNGSLTGYTLYTYNTNELAKVESFDKDGNLAAYTTSIHSGSDYTVSSFTKKDDKFQESSRYMLSFSNSKYTKLTYYSVNATSGKLEKTSQSEYNYSGDMLTVSSYDVDGALTMTAIYTFDNKKNASMNVPSVIPQLSNHNAVKIIYKDKAGKETYNYAVEYTYNENGYPLTGTSSGNTTTYQYDCK